MPTTVAATPGIMLLRVGHAGCALRWDAALQCWRWPDPVGGQLYAWPAPPAAPSGVRLQESACAMVTCSSGRLLMGLGKRLGLVELPAPGQPARPLQAQLLITVDAAEPRTRISDGCADRHGNFVFGTANTAPDQRPIGSFYQYSQRHGLRRLALPAVARAASLACSPDGSRLYFADAARGAILCCDYDPERARVSGAKTFSTLPAPDPGAAVTDRAGNLWSVQGGALVQYDCDGQPLQQIALAREAVSSLAFGGPGLRQLLVLGAQGGLYGLPPDLARGLTPGLADTPFHDSGSASSAGLPGWRD